MLTRLLGEGGMGAVYEAEHELLATKKAVKVLLPRWTQQKEIVQRFVREARTAAGIGHRNVITVDDFGHLPDGQMFMMMPFLDGKGLDDVVRQWGRFTAEDALEILAQVCAGLQAAHHRGVVHRDLKPANIYLTHEHGLARFVRILDFGIAKLTDDDSDGINTRTGQVFGTISYMAPEQAIGAREVDHRVDIFALGVIAYQLVSGRVPYDGTSVGAIAVQHVQTRPDVSALLEIGVPAGFATAVGAALSYRPQDRPASAAVFARMLMDATPGGREIVQRAAPEILEIAAPAEETVKQMGSEVPTAPMAPPMPSGPATRAGHGGAAGTSGRGGGTMSMPPGGVIAGGARAGAASPAGAAAVAKQRTTLSEASGVATAPSGTARRGRRVAIIGGLVVMAAAAAVAIALVAMRAPSESGGGAAAATGATSSDASVGGEAAGTAAALPTAPAAASRDAGPSGAVATPSGTPDAGVAAAAPPASPISAAKPSSRHGDRGKKSRGDKGSSKEAPPADEPAKSKPVDEPAKAKPAAEPAIVEPAKPVKPATEPKPFNPDDIAAP